MYTVFRVFKHGGEKHKVLEVMWDNWGGRRNNTVDAFGPRLTLVPSRNIDPIEIAI